MKYDAFETTNNMRKLRKQRNLTTRLFLLLITVFILFLLVIVVFISPILSAAASSSSSSEDEINQRFGRDYIHDIDHQHNELIANAEPSISGKGLKIFCMVLTSPGGNLLRVDAVHNTWAKYCDKHVFIAKLDKNDKTDLMLRKYPYLEPNGLVNDSYNELGCKMYRAIYDIYLENPQYDWYLKADDDTYVFMENLREFLANKDINNPVTYGYNMKLYVKDGYQSGGAGYVMSYESFRRLGDKLQENPQYCQDIAKDGECKAEDVGVQRCLRSLGVYKGVSIDDEARERFHAFSVTAQLLGFFPGWINYFAENSIEQGLRSVSEQTITFHYMEPNVIEALHKLWTTYLFKKRNKLKTFPNFTSILYELC